MKIFFIVVITAALAFFVGRISAPGSREQIAAVAPSGSKMKSVGSTPRIRTIATPTRAPTSDFWAAEMREPRTPQTERMMCDYLQDLARHDPTAALNLAGAEANRPLREKLRDAALLGWGATEPDAAAKWALKLPLAERGSALQNVFAGARSPQVAAALASEICAADPAEAGNYGHALLAALQESGAFQMAAQFSLEHPELHADLLGSAYYEWAQHQPERALASVNAITNPEARTDAFRGMISGWSAANPPAVAEFAASMPPGKERSQTLAEALPRWASEDPAAASKWINDFTPDRDFDEGKSTIATSPQVFLQSPQAAASWAASIVDPTLRNNTLEAVISEWSHTDSAAARQYLLSNSKLSAEEREELLKEINPPATPPEN